jgi:hypothetical protein
MRNILTAWVLFFGGITGQSILGKIAGSAAICTRVTCTQGAIQLCIVYASLGLSMGNEPDDGMHTSLARQRASISPKAGL